jgi:6-pyruvoyltetrahydropterin/6-carboxytetrahydropterin synthase
MRVAKQFRWEAAHRLPWHEGLCRNVHGHSYHMTVEVEGPVGRNGMVVDFKVLGAVLKPLVERWDHALFVASDDAELLGVVRQTGWKHFMLPFDSTSENLACFAADHLCERAFETLSAAGITGVTVTVRETDTCFATYERPLLGEPATPHAESLEANHV